MKIENTPAAEARRQKGLAKQRAEIADQNAAALAAATYENGIWTFEIHGQSASWRKTALQMIEALAKREGSTSESLEFLIALPERGRAFSKSAGSSYILSHG